MPHRLKPFEIDLLRESRPTYAEVGATLSGLPDGYHHLERSAVIGRGPAAFESAADRLMHWGVQEGAGLSVTASSDLVQVGAVAVVRLGWSVLAVKAPVRVVAVIEDDRRRGFAYGTLPGHPECGEELFLVEMDDDGLVTLRIAAFSRPGAILGRIAGPAGRLVQRAVTRRYERALA